MNLVQRRILVVAAFMVAVMVLFPPYQVVNYQGLSIMAGYGFLFNLPEYFSAGSGIPSKVDSETLVMQIVGVVVTALLLYFAARSKDA